MNYRPLILLLSIVLVGAGCTTSPSTSTSSTTTPDDFADDYQVCYEMTSHESCIDNTGVDEALIGTWQLKSISVSGQPMNFKGHTLTFNGGGFSTDYSTEEYTGPTVPQGSCYFDGGTGGVHYENSEIDPNSIVFDDQGNQDLDAIVINNYIDIARQLGDISTTCTAAQTLVTQITNVSLGTGAADPSAIVQGSVLYQYTLDEDWSTLTLTADHVPVTYTYSRVN